MSIDLHVARLADHPEALSALEQLFLSEWAAHYGAGRPGDARQDLMAYSNRTELPVGLVAFRGEELCGMAALKAESVRTHAHLSPWLAAGIVLPHMRRQGIGARLARAVEETARSLGYTKIYCGTSTARSLLDRSGWQFIELVRYGGEDVGIYEKLL